MPSTALSSENLPRVTVLIDARGLYSSGIGRYLREVLKVLLQDGRFGSIILAGDPRDIGSFASTVSGGERIDCVEYRGGYYSLRAQREWAGRIAAAHPADVTFFPHYDVPLVRMPERSVVTVHDLIHYKVPSLFAWWRRWAGAVLLRKAVDGAARVIVVSHSTANDVVERYSDSAGRITTIQHGVPEGFFPSSAAEAEAERALVGGRFLLCVGNRKPHKNLRTAIEAFALVLAENPGLKLVLAGKADNGWARVTDAVAHLGVLDRIVDLGEVPDARLRSLYGAAEALIFPSLYEGFGLPLLEAMACGCPLVASNRSSMPEVVGDAGFLSDPLDAQGFAADVGRILTDPQLRSKMVTQSLERSKAFSLDVAGQRTADVLFETAQRLTTASMAGSK